MSAEAAQDIDPLITVRDAMRRLNIGRSWFYEALAAGRIQGVRFGRAWRVRNSVVEELVRTGVPAADPR